MTAQPATGSRAPSTASAVARFMLGSLAAIAVVVVGGFFALRTVATHEAERNTRSQVQTLGRLVQSAGLSDGVLRGDPRALRRLDDVVQGQVLNDSVIRTKVWTRDGRILYSDEPKLIGQRFGLGADEQELFDGGGADAELSDLTKPENRYERPAGKLLEAHTVIRTPSGRPVLFEIYQRFASINADGARLLRTLAPPLLAALAVLLLFQVPLAWRMARRLQRGHRDRERLLAAAVESSERERGRIASDLHDGVVQDLAGVAFGLAPLAADAEHAGDAKRAGVLHDAIARLRQGVRDLRTLLVEIHPPRLESAGLEPALSDLLSPLEAAGITTALQVEDKGGARSHASDPLIYRAAREAIRNAQEHAAPSTVEVTVARPQEGLARLTVRDDGGGFDPSVAAAAGHVGLTLLGDLARQSGGRLDVRSEPGEGTTVVLDVPA